MPIPCGFSTSSQSRIVYSRNLPLLSQDPSVMIRMPRTLCMTSFNSLLVWCQQRLALLTSHNPISTPYVFFMSLRRSRLCGTQGLFIYGISFLKMTLCDYVTRLDVVSAFPFSYSGRFSIYCGPILHCVGLIQYIVWCSVNPGYARSYSFRSVRKILFLGDNVEQWHLISRSRRNAH